MSSRFYSEFFKGLELFLSFVYKQKMLIKWKEKYILVDLVQSYIGNKDISLAI